MKNCDGCSKEVGDYKGYILQAGLLLCHECYDAQIQVLKQRKFGLLRKTKQRKFELLRLPTKK